MGRSLKIGLYSPFFGSTLGGGEKYFGVTAEAIRDAFPQHHVEILTPVPVDRARYERMLGLDLRGMTFRPTTRRVTRLHRMLNAMPALRLYRDLVVGAQAVRFTRDYDLYFAMVYVIRIHSRARYSIMLCQFPYPRAQSHRPMPALVWQLYSLPYRLLRPLLIGDEIRSFQEIICQSQYVRHWVQEYWQRDPLVINPPIDVPEREPAWDRKENIIVSVGRFFTGGHAKQQDLMVRVFRDLCEAGLQGWELHLAGSVHRDGQNAGNYERVVELARGFPIRFHPDAPYETVQDLYDRAAVYWHAAGYKADTRDPSTLEHFGMTTAEAMGHGAVPVVIASGGQPEVVEDGTTGYLWRTLDELKSRTLALTREPQLRQELAEAARRSSHRFSRASFRRKMVEALAPAIHRLEEDAATAKAGDQESQGQRQTEP
jgi:glycosyltransferase involved in cell wall biosynthesis